MDRLGTIIADLLDAADWLSRNGYDANAVRKIREAAQALRSN